MSVQATIDISFHTDLKFRKVLTETESLGWSYNDYGNITYLDNDDYDWKTKSLKELEQVKTILFRRFQNDQIVAIVFTKDDVGFSLQFMPNKKELMLSLNINRKQIGNSRTTDFSYYLERIFPILKNASSISCNDIY